MRPDAAARKCRMHRDSIRQLRRKKGGGSVHTHHKLRRYAAALACLMTAACCKPLCCAAASGAAADPDALYQLHYEPETEYSSYYDAHAGEPRPDREIL